MKLDKEKIKRLMRSIAATEDREIGCDECFNEIDRFVELELEGKHAAEALPLVKEHLDRCGNCHEEYQALLKAVKKLSAQ